jgi:hypothetical protein
MTTADISRNIAIARTIDADAGERGLIDTELLRNQLTLLGHPSEKVDEMMYIADRRCVGKISYMQYWNALLPYLFENRIRHIASTIHPIFRSEEALPELESITPPTSPRPAHDAEDFTRLSSGFSRLPSAASSIVSVVSQAAQQIARGISRLPSLSGGNVRRGGPMDGSMEADEASNHTEAHAKRAQASRPAPLIDLDGNGIVDAQEFNTADEASTQFGEPVNGTQDAKGHGEHAYQDAEPQAPRDELADLAGQVMERSLLFYALDLKVTRAFLRLATQLTLQPGEHLHNEDDEIPCISVVRSGTLMLYRPAEEEGTIGEAAMHAIVIAEQTEPKLEAFGRLEAGDVIGEMNCLLKEACSVVFRAETKTRLLQIPRRDLFKMLPRNSREVPV